MRLPRAARAPLLVRTLVAGGLAYFVSSLGSAYAGLRAPALAAIAAGLLVYLVRRVEAAWLISAGLAASMFSGHWSQFGLGPTLVPDRVLIVSGVAAVLLRLGPARDRPPLELRGVHFALAAAVAYAVISALMAGTLSDHNSLFAMIDQFGVIPFVVFTIAPLAFRTEHQRRILLGTLVATGAYLSLTALLEKLKLNALIFPGYITDPSVGIHYGRARGPFVEAVANGLALYACAVAAVIAFVIWRRRWQRAAALATAGLCLVGVQLTVTRAVWLGAVVASVFVLVAVPRLRRYLLPAAALGLCLVLVAFAAIPGLYSQASGRESDKSPIWERQNADAAALRMIAAKPLVGFGWFRHDTAKPAYFRLDPTIPLTGETVALHNLFLAYAVDLGLVGFGLWLLAGALAFGAAVRGRAPPELEPWRVGLGALVACYITAGIAGPLAYLYPTLLLWTWAGVAYQAVYRTGDRGTSSAAGARRDDLERLPGEAA